MKDLRKVRRRMTFLKPTHQLKSTLLKATNWHIPNSNNYICFVQWIVKRRTSPLTKCEPLCKQKYVGQHRHQQQYMSVARTGPSPVLGFFLYQLAD